MYVTLFFPASCPHLLVQNSIYVYPHGLSFMTIIHSSFLFSFPLEADRAFDTYAVSFRQEYNIYRPHNSLCLKRKQTSDLPVSTWNLYFMLTLTYKKLFASKAAWKLLGSQREKLSSVCLLCIPRCSAHFQNFFIPHAYRLLPRPQTDLV